MYTKLDKNLSDEIKRFELDRKQWIWKKHTKLKLIEVIQECMNTLYIIRLIYHIRWENDKEKATISILNISLSI